MTDGAKLFKRILVFLVILLVFMVAVNHIYFKTVNEKKIIYRVGQDYRNFSSHLENNEIDYIFFGDSHTKNAINPEFIPNSYNFAGNGGNYVAVFFELRRIIEKDNIKVNNIVLEIDPHTFSSKLYDWPYLISDIWYWKNMASYEELSNLTKRQKANLFFEANFPFIGSGQDIEVLWMENSITPINRGWIGDYRNFTDSNKTAGAIANYRLNFRGQKENVSSLGMAYLEKTLNIAAQNNISIIFIKYPLSEDYVNVISENGINQEEYYGRISQQINQTLTNYLFLDYQSFYFGKDEYFSDATHLNPLGADILSKEINEDLLRVKNE